MSRLGQFVAVVALLVCAVGAAHADFVSVDLTPYANTDFRMWMPAFPTGSQTLGGVPFGIATTTNNIWYSRYASGGTTRTLSLEVNQAGVTTVHTLINTIWGQQGPQCYAWIEFFGTGGAYYRKDLVGNIDIRDYNQGSWTNYINGTTTTQVFNSGNQRLDKQTIGLPAAFSNQTLTQIALTDAGANDFQRTFISGITLEAVVVPEPSSVLVLAVGITGMLAVLRRPRF